MSPNKYACTYYRDVTAIHIPLRLDRLIIGIENRYGQEVFEFNQRASGRLLKSVNILSTFSIFVSL